jgi:hypothetical protein
MTDADTDGAGHAYAGATYGGLEPVTTQAPEEPETESVVHDIPKEAIEAVANSVDFAPDPVVEAPAPPVEVPMPIEVPSAQAPQPPAPPPVSPAPATLSIKDRAYAALEKIRFRKRAKLDKILVLAAKKRSIKNDDVQLLLRVSDATATNYLNELVIAGKLKRVGSAAHAAYEPV